MTSPKQLSENQAQQLNWKTILRASFTTILTVILLIGIPLIGGVRLLEQQENKRYQSEVRSQILHQLSAKRAFIEGVLNTELHLAQNLAAAFSLQNKIEKQYFLDTTRYFIENSRYVRNIGLAKGVILTYIYPLQGNEAVLGLDYSKNKLQWGAVKRAIDSRKPIIAGPLKLVQGGIGIINRIPIYMTPPGEQVNSGNYIGILSTVINMDLLLSDTKLNDIKISNQKLNIALRGKDGLGAEGEVFYGQASVFDSNPVTLEVRLPQGQWQLGAAPENGWELSSDRITNYRIVAAILFFSMVLILGIFIWQQNRELIQRRLAESELRKNQKVLIKKTHEAEVANRAKSEFISNMSHEIRTPLNAVIGFSALLLKTDINKKQKSYLDSIQTGGKTLLTLINDILDLAKIEANKLEIQPKPIELRNIFKELQQLFTLQIADKGLEFRVEIDKMLPTALVLDEHRLRQILLNLISNAIKFTEEGHINITVHQCKKENNTIDLIIAVEDTGIGIPKNQQDKIFDSFQQVDGQSTRKYGGTGLGLAITKRLIKMMKADITIKSQVGVGSIFEITLRNVSVYKAAPVIMDDDINTISFEKVEKEEKIEISPELRAKLDKLIPIWESFDGALDMDDIGNFANDISALGVKYQVDYIKNYGDHLCELVDNFEFDKIRQGLDRFFELR